MKPTLKRTLPIVFLAWLLPAATLPARADDVASARKAIAAQYERLDAATSRKDPSPPEGVLTPGFRHITVHNDEYDTHLWTSVWRQGVAALETVTARSNVQSVAREGETVRAVVHGVFEGRVKPEMLAGNVRVETTVHDTWVKNSSGWRLQSSAQVRLKTWTDGVLAADETASRPLEAARRDAVVSELRARAIPFETVAPGSGFDDLEAFDGIVGDARIVALGEATHGTAEFFRMKHRLFEYLVEKKGFTVFAFEANWPAVEAVDRYVKTGEGSAAKALEAMHEVWQTQEVRDLVEWMRAYNSAPGRKKLLSFTGFDMQGPAQAVACVMDAFRNLGEPDAKTMLAYYTIPGNDIAKLRAGFADALKLVEARRDALVQHWTSAGYERIRRCATVIVQLTGIDPIAGITGYFNVRDKAMAENVKWLAHEVFPNEKIVLWAHNSHIAATREANVTWVSMGQHLRQTFGTQMRIVGFAFDRGEVSHIPFHSTGGANLDKAIAARIPAASPTSSEAVLRAAGLPRFILDLRAVPAGGALGTWLAEPQKQRKMGWGGVALDDPATAYPMVSTYVGWVLPKAFDALVYVEESTATALLK